MAVSSAMPLTAIDAVVLDTETTGLDSRLARIIQIGAVRLRAGLLEQTPALDVLLDPGMVIPAATIAVHGITDSMVAGQPTFSEVLPRLDALLSGNLMIGHATRYDIAMIAREYAMCGKPWRPPRALDVRLLARIVAPTLADHGLDRLCEWAGVTNKGRHTALGDAVATAEVFLALVPMLRKAGIKTLAEAEAACRRLLEGESRTTGGIGDAGPDAASSDVAAIARVDSFVYSHRVRDVMSAPAVFVAPETTLREAMREMVARRISSVLIRSPSGSAHILTERDVLRAINADGGAALDLTALGIAKGPLTTIDADAFVYRAVGRIERLGFRHLGVEDASGEIVGMVTTRNLLRHRSSTAIVLGDAIAVADTPAQLAAAWAQLPALVQSLVREHVDPRTICAIISAEICAMTGRASELAQRMLESEGLGRPPVPYAVMVLGSAGRGESQLTGDQDNAIVYAEGAADSATDRYFEALGVHMCQILDTAGLPRCKGGVMAANRAWRMSLADWQATVDGWIRRHSPEDLLNVDIFFDAVAVSGDASLAEHVWSYAFERAHATVTFQKLLTELGRRRAPPFTLLGGFRVDEKGRIDLKKSGLMPIFTCARVLAIRHDIRQRSTPDRLRPLPGKGVGSREILDAIIDAQTHLLSVILAQQLSDCEAGIPLSTRIDPSRLDRSGRTTLKKALSTVDEIVGIVSEGRI